MGVRTNTVRLDHSFDSKCRIPGCPYAVDKPGHPICREHFLALPSALRKRLDNPMMDLTLQLEYAHQWLLDEGPAK